jgi:antitoxin (DNA-binding transcriptional repressor) of toxin-antitoxin stability system
MTRTVTIQQLQQNADSLLANLGESDEIIIADAGKPIARISPTNKPKLTGPRESGFLKGQIHTTEDFDDPLPDSFWLGES